MAKQNTGLGILGQYKVKTQSGGHAVRLSVGPTRHVQLVSWEDKRAEAREDDVLTRFTPEQARTLADALARAAREIDEMEKETDAAMAAKA